MNAAESVKLVRFVVNACPAQKMEDYTAEAWLLLLGDLSYDDAIAAAVTVARAQPFVSPAEIRTEVRRIRTGRLTEAPPTDPPAGLDPDDVAGYLRWKRANNRAIADGQPVTPAPVPALNGPPERVRDELNKALRGKEMPDA